jgi:hypothetical protein
MASFGQLFSFHSKSQKKIKDNKGHSNTVRTINRNIKITKTYKNQAPVGAPGHTQKFLSTSKFSPLADLQENLAEQKPASVASQWTVINGGSPIVQ